MQELRGRTAVVTGGASGIGRALAERFLDEGMRVVIADVEQAALDAAAAALAARGEVLAVHGVVTLSETLQRELAMVGSAIGVSVLCPGFVQTGIADADRNRPAALRNATVPERPAEIEQMIRGLLAAGLPPAQVAGAVVDAIRAGRFYVLTHPELLPIVRQRMEDVLEGRAPSAMPLLR
jgi:NAD(P)-dependent dehydrogenase (short-subunit alcohol dehydrogenase family)